VQAEYEEELNYNLIKEEGPDHAKVFGMEARIGTRVVGRGEGPTKKAAEQEAAYHALLALKEER
jgi:ribonuclease-3